MMVLMGGSFDPVHQGHLQSASELATLLGVDSVTLVPAARSPFKPTSTADAHRLAMLQLAIDDYPGLTIDTRELTRPAPSYTVDTLRDVRRQAGESEPVVWVIGSDTLSELDRWKDWQDLIALAHLVIVQRPGFALPEQGPVADWLATLPTANSPDALKCAPHGLYLQVALTPCPLSSTALRQALANGQAPEGIPPAVMDYIRLHQLYSGKDCAATESPTTSC